MQMLQQHHLLLLPRQLRLRPLLQQLLVMARQQMPALQLQRTAPNSKPRLPLLVLLQPLPPPVLLLARLLLPPLRGAAVLLLVGARLRRARVVGANVTQTTASYSLYRAGRPGATAGQGVTRVTLPLLLLLLVVVVVAGKRRVLSAPLLLPLLLLVLRV
jgi:hypothetical protein